MAVLRVNNVGDVTGVANPITLANATTNTVSWLTAPANMPTVATPDILKLVVEPNTPFEEILYLTTYTLGSTTGVATRAAEGPGIARAHTGTAWVHGPTAADFPGPQGPQGATGPTGPQGPQGAQGSAASVNPLVGAGSGTTVLSTQVTGNGFQSLALKAGGDIWVGDGTANPLPAIALRSNGTLVGRGTAMALTGGNAFGLNALAGGSSSTALGQDTSATGQGSVAAGWQATASGPQGVSIGQGSLASGNQAVAVGAGAGAIYDYSTALGPNAGPAFANQVAVGGSYSQLACKGLATGLRSISANTTLDLNDCVVVVTANNVAVTLPPPSAVGPGATYRVKAFNGVIGTLLKPYASETIDQYASYPIAGGSSVDVATDGTDWFLLNAPMPVAVALRFPFRVPSTSPTTVLVYSVPVAGMYRVSGYLVSAGSTTATIYTSGGDGPSTPVYYWQGYANGSTTQVAFNGASVTATSYAILSHTVHATTTGSSIFVSVQQGTASTLTISATLELVQID